MAFSVSSSACTESMPWNLLVFVPSGQAIAYAQEKPVLCSKLTNVDFVGVCNAPSIPLINWIFAIANLCDPRYLSIRRTSGVQMASNNPGLSDVAKRKREIAADIERLQTEFKELEIAERVLSALIVRPTPAESNGTFNALSPNEAPRPGRKNTAGYIEEVLLESPLPWLSTESVQGAASTKAGREIPIGTIAPTLSNMKRDGIVFRDGNKVAHRDRAAEAGIAMPTQDFNEIVPRGPLQFGSKDDQ